MDVWLRGWELNRPWTAKVDQLSGVLRGRPKGLGVKLLWLKQLERHGRRTVYQLGRPLRGKPAGRMELWLMG